MSGSGKVYVYDEGVSGVRPAQYSTHNHDGTKAEDFLGGFFSNGSKPINIKSNDTLVLQSKTENRGNGSLHVVRDAPTGGFKIQLPDYMVKDGAQLRVGSVTFDEKTKQVRYSLYVMDDRELDREKNHTTDRRSRVTIDVVDDFSGNPALFKQAQSGEFTTIVNGKAVKKPFNIIENVTVTGIPRDADNNLVRDQIGVLTSSNDPVTYKDLIAHNAAQKKTAGRAISDDDLGSYSQWTTSPPAHPSRALNEYRQLANQGAVPAADPKAVPYWDEVLNQEPLRNMVTGRQDLGVGQRQQTNEPTTSATTEMKLVNGMYVMVPKTAGANVTTDNTVDNSTSQGVNQTEADNRAIITNYADNVSRTFSNGKKIVGNGDGALSESELKASLGNLKDKLGSNYAQEIDELYLEVQKPGRLTPEVAARFAALIRTAEGTDPANTRTAAMTTKGYVQGDEYVKNDKTDAFQDQLRALAIIKWGGEDHVPKDVMRKLSDGFIGPESDKWAKVLLKGRPLLLDTYLKYGPEAVMEPTAGFEDYAKVTIKSAKMDDTLIASRTKPAKHAEVAVDSEKKTASSGKPVKLSDADQAKVDAGERDRMDISEQKDLDTLLYGTASQTQTKETPKVVSVDASKDGNPTITREELKAEIIPENAESFNDRGRSEKPNLSNMVGKESLKGIENVTIVASLNNKPLDPMAVMGNFQAIMKGQTFINTKTARPGSMSAKVPTNDLEVNG